MDGVTAAELAIFLSAAFAAALVAGLAGFAFGLIAAAAWLHVLSPSDTAALIVGFGLAVQGVAVWKLRRALHWHRLWAFLAGGALGVPLGAMLLEWTRPSQLRAAIGMLLVAYGLYALVRPALKPLTGAPLLADAGVGFLSGILGGSTGLGGILPTIWCGLRGWSNDEQRAVYQPAAVAIFLMAALWLDAQGNITRVTIGCSCLGCRCCSPALGWAWDSMESSTRWHSARWCSSCCSRPGSRSWWKTWPVFFRSPLTAGG